MSEWTNEPPTEPGFYWMRSYGGVPPFWCSPAIIELSRSGEWFAPGEERSRWLEKPDARTQFWAQRIEPPGA